MATQLDQATRDAVMAEANARAQRFGISPEQALYNYARENNISNADVDTYMGYAPGSADNWVKQRDAANAVTHPNAPAPATTVYQPPAPAPAPASAPQPLYAGLSNTSSASDIANAYRQWSNANGGDTTDNQRTAESYLSGLGLGRDAIYSAYDAYKAPQPLYAGLNNNSSASDIANAYRQWSSTNGGDTTENQRAAESYLQSLGIGSGAINDAYAAYNQPTQVQPPQQTQPSTSLGFSNPYMSAQADAITSQYTKALNQQVLPGIGHGSTMAGGYGGSRHGIAQGMAIDSMGQNLSNSLANMYGQNYQQDQNTATQRGGQLFQYNLGLGGLENQRYGMDQGFYTNNRHLDQSGAALGMNLYNQGTQGNLAQGQGVYNVGTQQQNAPWAVTNNATNNTSPYTGTGVSDINTQQGSTAANTAGGALAGAQLWNLGFGNTNKG